MRISFGFLLSRPSHLNLNSKVVEESVLVAAIVQYGDLSRVPKQYSNVSRNNVVSKVMLGKIHLSELFLILIDFNQHFLVEHVSFIIHGSDLARINGIC